MTDTFEELSDIKLCSDALKQRGYDFSRLTGLVAYLSSGNFPVLNQPRPEMIGGRTLGLCPVIRTYRRGVEYFKQNEIDPKEYLKTNPLTDEEKTGIERLLQDKEILYNQLITISQNSRPLKY